MCCDKNIVLLSNIDKQNLSYEHDYNFLKVNKY